MTFNPAKTALVAMDFQPSILATLEDTGPLLERVAAAISATRKAGGKIATVRVAVSGAEIAEFPEHSAMGNRMKSFADKVAPDAPTTQVVAEIGASDPDVAVRKIRVGPFGTSDLDSQLRAIGVDTLVLAGIHTSGCVLTGVREGHDLDYRIVVLADACADPDPEMHEYLCGKVFPKQGEVITVDQYLAALDRPCVE